MARIDSFLKLGKEQLCSDIHLTVGLPPLVRLDGELIPLKYRSLTSEEAAGLIDEILPETQKQELASSGSTDLSYESPGLGRFRINVAQQLRGVSAFCRVIPGDPPALEDLGLPEVLPQLIQVKSGLVLITGTAGTGKSTTLAALIGHINRTQDVSVLTLEDPIEFVHTNDRAQIVQRELGTHMHGFSDGLRSALRQDPDVILVGELRDRETISMAIEASETGHLVFSTLHTRGAYQTIHRLVDAFPTDAQAQVRHTLADTLRCVMTQDLVRLPDGRGRRAATEVMVMTPAISQLIREGKNHQLAQAIATGRRHGMHLMDQSLMQLVRAGAIDPNQAYLKAQDKREFQSLVTDADLSALIEGTGGIR